MARTRCAPVGFAVLLAWAVPSTVSGDARVNYAFDDVGRLASVTTELGTTRYKYFDTGSIQEMVDPGGWRYSFDEGDAPATLASAAPNFLPSFAASVSSPLDLSANRFLFTGFMYERELGLYSTPSGRFYDPLTGRFIQEDSYLGKPAEPPSLHRYLYALDNPLRYIDPSGHQSIGAEHCRAYACAEETRRQLDPLFAVTDRVERTSVYVRKKVGEVGMGISIAAANTLKALNSPGHMTPEAEKSYYIHPETPTEDLASRLTDIGLTAAPLLTRSGPRGPPEVSLHPGAAAASEVEFEASATIGGTADRHGGCHLRAGQTCRGSWSS